MASKHTDMLFKLAMLGIAGYVGYKVLNAVKDKLDDFSKGAGNWWANLTMDPLIQSNTAIAISPTQQVDPARGTFQRVGDQTRWTFNQVTYVLQPRNANGIYGAVKL